MCVCVNEKMCERSFYVCKCVSACVQVLSSECGCMSVREREKRCFCLERREKVCVCVLRGERERECLGMFGEKLCVFVC